ncbi:hypothetical protein [Plesiomonas sp.]|uniref:hypothetical protein n=1 Tax=Plesiomonas sp. TaxID=2486279 RepID=UPI003F300C29
MQQLTLSTYVADEAKALKSKKHQTIRKKKEERRKKKEERRKKKEENIRDIDSSDTTIEYTEHWHKKNADIISAPQKYMFAI